MANINTCGNARPGAVPQAGADARPGPRPRVTLVVARARNGVIGRGNALPWHLPEDLKHFRRLTIGHPIVMGRRTHESIGRVLPGRRNIVVSRTPGWHADGVEVAASLDEALARCAGCPEAFVVGGAQLFRAAWPLADRAVFTEIDADFDGDVRLDAPDAARWRAVQRDEAIGANGLRYAVVTYERTANTDSPRRAAAPGTPQEQ